ncbi:MAG: hypothetical protein KCHDKBKB_01719 [Elusimicrobia bacterium]|nr:hypothetical protein [Elusimicrobiota bacterium]
MISRFVRLVLLGLHLGYGALSQPRSVCGFELPAGVSQERFSAEILWKSFEALAPSERPRVILVLGGGGAKGLSHIGVLRVLKEERIPIDEIVGVSVGALIGAVYAAGVDDAELEVMAHEIGWDKLTDVSQTSALRMILSDELLSTQGMEDYLKKHIGEKTFMDLPIPFSCLATDIRTGERVILREGSVAFAARASATIPGLFKPVPFRQRLLVDGGLVDNLPTDIIENKRPFDVVLAVLPKADKLPSEKLTVFRSLSRAIEIQGGIFMKENRKYADIVIEPEVGDISIIDLKRSRECIEAGTLASRRWALDIKNLLLRRAREALGKNRP